MPGGNFFVNIGTFGSYSFMTFQQQILFKLRIFKICFVVYINNTKNC